MYKLNPQQQRAVRHADGPLLVLAGAGSGKTGVITRKIAWLIREQGLEPQHLCAVTFTNKAAREMKRRVGELLDTESARRVNVSTFHTLGLNVIRSELARLGLRKGFSILDGEDAGQVVRELMRSELSADPALAQQVQWCISRWKNALVTPEQAAGLGDQDSIGQAAARIYQSYLDQLHALNAVDLDDLILHPVNLFRGEPDLAAAWRERLRYLLVDEYQDTNATQYELVKQLVGRRGALTVVGDDDQSIYAWRGARPENLKVLADDFPDLTVIKLEQNYRSSGRILKAANAVIARNSHVFDKRLWSDMGYGDPLKVVRARDEEHEAQRVVSAILHHRFQHSGSWRDYAILYRGNHQSRLFERVLREHRIPYYLSGETSFFERSEIKDLMAYLRIVANPDDDNALLRIVNTPRRGIGAATLEKLGRLAGEHGMSLLRAAREPAATSTLGDRGGAAMRGFAHWLDTLTDNIDHRPTMETVAEILRESGYEAWLRETSKDETTFTRRWENVLELVGWLKRLAERDANRTLPELVADLTLAGILEREDGDASGDQVALMTLHAAKGLEFPHVFIVGVEEGSLPHRSSIEEDAIEEERRLFYVGITRARRSLTLSFAARRKRYGEVVDCVPSRFIDELPGDDLQWEGGDAELAPEEKKARARAHLDGIRSMLTNK